MKKNLTVFTYYVYSFQLFYSIVLFVYLLPGYTGILCIFAAV